MCRAGAGLGHWRLYEHLLMDIVSGSKHHLGQVVMLIVDRETQFKDIVTVSEAQMQRSEEGTACKG
jgi:hypothetical protein